MIPSTALDAERESWEVLVCVAGLCKAKLVYTVWWSWKSAGSVTESIQNRQRSREIDFKLTTVGVCCAFAKMLLDNGRRIHPMNRTVWRKVIMMVEIRLLVRNCVVWTVKVWCSVSIRCVSNRIYGKIEDWVLAWTGSPISLLSGNVLAHVSILRVFSPILDPPLPIVRKIWWQKEFRVFN
jgi:hypothetical protein